ncbi:MAG TPA: GIY-YIG nuclease family protein [Verrucomicrobiota bacterium]|nr:GIY-YIG nuclease family protein [Verrucomicrobiota bacterium]HNU50896.1 GIY-YIG nuclease family protein [Verrucomicrobiota bacterium]
MTPGFHYVYILESSIDRKRFYVGLATNLEDRLARHNRGDVPHTSKYRPWQVKSAIAFRDADRAAAFERYLKTGSGRAFTKKRL